MVRPLICLVLAGALWGCGGVSSPDTPPTTAVDTGADPVYVSVVLHYEETFVQDARYFARQREDLVALAEYLAGQGIVLNLGPDWAFMKAVDSFETDRMRRSTMDKTILRYLREDLGHEIDPHAHEHGWNYADVAYLIEQQGVEPSRIASGLVVDPPEDSVYDQFLSPIEASRFPGYTWQAEWLWGDATAGHVNDTPASGIWRPRDRDHFYEHDDAGPIPVIGKYTNDIAGVYDLIDKVQAGEIEGGHMLTAAIFIGQGSVSSMLEELQEEMPRLKEAEAAGSLRFVSLKAAGLIWRSEYDGEGFLYIP